MTRDAAWHRVAVMLVAGSVACGRTDPGDGPAEPFVDASALDAANDSKLGYPDSKLEYVEATVTDSYAAADESAAADSSLDASLSPDAAEGPDASRDASASDAAEPHSPCDQCRRGDQQCEPLPQVCAPDDAGVVSCDSPGPSIWTCVAGDAGCAVWAGGAACRSDVPCCVPCTHALDCPFGALGDSCEQDTDCAFDACDAVTHECTSDSCRDHRQDGQETDVDCGGPLCTACLVGRGCQSNFDCQSGHLCGASHVCQ